MFILSTYVPWQMLVPLVFILGTVVGSFLNVIIIRLEKGEQAVKGRSHCMSCGAELRWFELIPILSFFFQKGKCRRCAVRLSLQYPLVEFGTGVLFVLVLFHVFPRELTYKLATQFSTLRLIFELIIWALFVSITVYDFRTKLIPDRFSFTLAGFSFLFMCIGEQGFVIPTPLQFLAGPLLFLPFYLLWKVSSGRWLGLGDGKLALGIGWFLGLAEGGTAVLFAFWIGAGVSVLIILWQNIRKYITQDSLQQDGVIEPLTLKSEIPFGPFLVLGTLLTYFFHLNMYTYLLF